MTYTKLKRILDFSFAFVLFIVLLPAFILISVGIKLDSKGPILFKQKRVGKRASNFYIFKFRTMRNDSPKETATHLLDNPEYWITKFGRFLRKTSLDELPQLLNILRGEMSFVGPRPALWNQYDLIAERNKYGANDITPGITGWAQVNGRDGLVISEKARLDGIYVKKISLWTDVKLVFKTALVVLRREGNIEGGTGSIENKKR